MELSSFSFSSSHNRVNETSQRLAVETWTCSLLRKMKLSCWRNKAGLSSSVGRAWCWTVRPWAWASWAWVVLSHPFCALSPDPLSLCSVQGGTSSPRSGNYSCPTLTSSSSTVRAGTPELRRGSVLGGVFSLLLPIFYQGGRGSRATSRPGPGPRGGEASSLGA